MSANDQESPLDSLLEMEEQESAVRRWSIGLISIMGLAAFVGVAWYVYQPKLDVDPDLSVPVTFASAAPVAAMQAEPGAVAAARQVSPADAAMATAEPAIDATVSVEDGTVTNSADAGSATVTADTGTVMAAEMVPSTVDLALAPSEAGIARPSHGPTADPVESRAARPVEERAMVIDPAALLTNRDQVDDLSVTSLVQPKHGKLVANGDGTFTSQPDADYTGTDSFSYTVTVYHALGSTASEPKLERLSAAVAEQRLLRLRRPFLQGQDVVALQQALAAKDIAVDVDGVFGPGTKAAVIAFQERKGLNPDGIVGPGTRSRLDIDL